MKVQIWFLSKIDFAFVIFFLSIRLVARYSPHKVNKWFEIAVFYSKIHFYTYLLLGTNWQIVQIWEEIGYSFCFKGNFFSNIMAFSSLQWCLQSLQWCLIYKIKHRQWTMMGEGSLFTKSRQIKVTISQYSLHAFVRLWITCVSDVVQWVFWCKSKVFYFVSFQHFSRILELHFLIIGWLFPIPW